jgi:hypothetical protein
LDDTVPVGKPTETPVVRVTSVSESIAENTTMVASFGLNDAASVWIVARRIVSSSASMPIDPPVTVAVLAIVTVVVLVTTTSAATWESKSNILPSCVLSCS